MVDTSKLGFAESEDALHEKAAEQVGYDDFGDPGYLEGLRVLLNAYDEEAHFNDYGRAAARETVLDTLRKRLTAERAWKQAPEMLEHSIERPIVICGLVRTGSTALHYLMGQDPDRQSLEYWLAGHPQPRPPRDTWDEHPDYRAAQAEIDGMYAADPSLKAVHFMREDLPEECRHLMMQEFTDDGLEVNASVPSYAAWYEQADLLPTYQRHKKLVQWIGSNDTDRPWLFKYPVHMRYLADFLEVYPDACVIQTHRDPLSVLPSYISLISGFRGIFEDDIDRSEIAHHVLELWARGAESAIEFRRRRDPAQFYDLHFGQFMKDPVAAVQDIHQHFGLDLSSTGVTALQTWQQENRQHKHGKHEYSMDPAEIGITSQEILDRFATYMDHFRMTPE